MLRVGYPATFASELLRDFPSEVELVPLPDDLDHEVNIDVWLPDPYSTLAIRIWPRLRGVRLVLALQAGTEWIPSLAGPHVTICNAHGAHNIATAEWTVSAILAMLKYFPFYLDVQRSGQWKRRFEAAAHYARITGDARPIYPPVQLEELTGKRTLLVGYGEIGKEIERMLAPFHVELVRVARTARTQPLVHAVAELDSLLPQAEVVILILPHTPESQ
jgi:phosphoglycerate dehydrogenase-like enzyme